MMIGEPAPSQYDWRFNLFGFPIRVTWLFWVINAALGYSIALGLNQAYRMTEQGSPGVFSFLLLWVLCAFVSVLIHELGHALAFRFFGIESQIVLYHMGGVAIPTAGFIFRRSGVRRRLSHWDQMIISAAGPLLQFASAILMAIVATAMGVRVPVVSDWLAWLQDIGIAIPWLGTGEATTNPWTLATFQFYILISIWWPLFNLLPVYPLDGGHIVQHAAAMIFRTDGTNEAYGIGAVTGFLVAYWFFQSGSVFNAMLFLSLAMSNVQAMQRLGGPPRW
ncbi:MAG: hypothetical protein RL240_2835 [Planctomycetota bacterium]|jgi:Zn-dependent protease